MAEITLYDRALQALAAAVRVDEAKTIRDQAERMRFLARQARDKQALADAAELSMRAERRLGELLSEARAAGAFNRGGRPRNGEPESAALTKATLQDAGIDYKLSSASQKLAAFDPARFDAYIAEARSKILGGRAVVVNPVKDLNTQDKALRRRIRLAQLAAKQKALPQKRYGVVLADPEWTFEVWSEAGLDRAADNHYPTSTLEALEARDVGSIAAEDCVLFLWVTAPHHAAGNGARLMRAWGFEPKAQVTWDKIEVGTGYWFRNQTEILLVGTRGHVPAPAPGTQWPDLVRSGKGAHSAKPDWAYELIEEYFPDLSKIELNARALRPGWDAWGYEAPDTESPSPAEPPPAIGTGGSEAETLVLSETEPADRDPLRASADGEGAPNSPSPTHSHLTEPSQSGAAGDEAGEPMSPGDRAPENGSPVLDPQRIVYASAVAAAVHLKGHHTKDTAEPIVRAAYACDPIVPTRQLAFDLGHPIGTALTWASRLELTKTERRNQAGTRWEAPAPGREVTA